MNVGDWVVYNIGDNKVYWGVVQELSGQYLIVNIIVYNGITKKYNITNVQRSSSGFSLAVPPPDILENYLIKMLEQ